MKTGLIFKDIKNILSRDDMKTIVAGCGGGGACTNCSKGVSYACGTNPLNNKCSCPIPDPTINNC